jgi:hypothetical protein
MAATHQHTCCQDDGFRDCPCWAKEEQSLPENVSTAGSMKVFCLFFFL